MFETYFLYITVFILAAAGAYAAERCCTVQQRILARAFCFLSLFVPAALRYGIGTDYFSYYAIYDNNFPSYMQQLEPGFVLIGHLCRMIGLSPHMFIAAISGITYALICFCVPRKHIFTVVVFFILSFIYLNSYNVNRQVLATAVLLCAFSQFYVNHRKNGLILCIIASLIHYSSLVAIPILIISMVRMNAYLRLGLMVMFALVAMNEAVLSMLISFATSINPRNAALSLLLVKTELNLGITLMIFALPPALILLNARKIAEQHNGNFILNANAAFLVVILLAFGITIMGRFIDALFFIPLFSIQVLYNANRRYAKLFHALLVLCFCAVFFRYIDYHTVGAVNQTYGIAPYSSILWR